MMSNKFFDIRSVGTARQWRESDICDLSLGRAGLRIVVEFWLSPTDRHFVDYLFEANTRFRMPEEADLAVYWQSGDFSDGHFLYEVIGGGWTSADKLGEGLLDICIRQECREWFLRTSNW